MAGDGLNTENRPSGGQLCAETIGVPDIRSLNRSRIYQALYRNGPQTRQALSDSLSLSLPTIARNLYALQQEGLVQEHGALESTGGRRARTAAVVSDARLALGMELSDRHVSISAVDLFGSVRKSEHVLLDFDGGEAAWERLSAIVGRFVQGCSERLLGVGIALAARISPEGSSVLSSPIPALQALTTDAFYKLLPCPCRFFSDVNAAVRSELWGIENERRSLYYLSLGRLVRGAGSAEGCLLPECAPGHLILHPFGERCACGKRGCVEAYCGAQVLESCAGGRLINFFVNLERENERYQHVWKGYLQNLALTIANLAAVSGCEVVLGGNVGCSLDDYLAQLRILSAGPEEPPVRISICGYRNEAPAVGAALAFVRTYLQTI